MTGYSETQLPPDAAQLQLDLGADIQPSFANFIIGKNGAAVAALLSLSAHKPGSRFLYFWGLPGCGRTHLLTAAGKAYGVERFTPASAASIPENSSGIWLLDDIDRLDAAGQAATFRLLNALKSGQGCFIAAGKSPPLALPLREDLRTRIGNALVYEIHELSDQDKQEALQKRALEKGSKLPSEVIEYLMHRLPRDMGSLTRWIDALDAWALQWRRPVTIPLVRALMRE